MSFVLGGALRLNLLILGLRLGVPGVNFGFIFTLKGRTLGPCIDFSRKGLKKVQKRNAKGSWNGCIFAGISIYLESEKVSFDCRRGRIEVQALFLLLSASFLLFLFRIVFWWFFYSLVSSKAHPVSHVCSVVHTESAGANFDDVVYVGVGARKFRHSPCFCFGRVLRLTFVCAFWFPDTMLGALGRRTNSWQFVMVVNFRALTPFRRSLSACRSWSWVPFDFRFLK